MKYLFFDIECSNCFDGVGKICEFGYVLTDEHFNIISKDVIPMSPGRGGNNRFNLTGRKDHRDLVLAWDYDFYFDQPEFPTFYQRIKKLMSSNDVVCFGFDCDNDISYLYSACKRYKLDVFNYVCYDVQKFANNYLEGERSSLKKTYIKLVGTQHIAELQEHLSRDDALMTMRIFEAVCTLKNMSSEQVLNEYDDAKTSFNKWLENKIASEHIDKDAISNMNDGEEIQFKNFIIDLSKLAESNRNNEVVEVVSHQDAFKAQYIVTNIKLVKDGDALLFLTSMALLNTYVKQKEHDLAIGYWFKDLLKNLLIESKHTIFKTLKINYINKELNGNNILIFEFCDIYQFSYHCVERKWSKLILKEYKCDKTYWGIKNKTFINELFKRVTSNTIGFSNLTTHDEELLKQANEYSEEMIKHLNLTSDSSNEIKKFNNKGQRKSDSRILWEEYYQECLPLLDNASYIGKHYDVSKFIKDDLDLTRKVIEKLKQTKSLAINSIAKSDYLLVLDKSDQMRFESIFKEPYKGKYILLKDFLA